MIGYRTAKTIYCCIFLSLSVPIHGQPTGFTVKDGKVVEVTVKREQSSPPSNRSQQPGAGAGGSSNGAGFMPSPAGQPTPSANFAASINKAEEERRASMEKVWGMGNGADLLAQQKQYKVLCNGTAASSSSCQKLAAGITSLEADPATNFNAVQKEYKALCQSGAVDPDCRYIRDRLNVARARVAPGAQKTTLLPKKSVEKR
jgi:hypothetical protein